VRGDVKGGEPLNGPNFLGEWNFGKVDTDESVIIMYEFNGRMWMAVGTRHEYRGYNIYAWCKYE
jgi:hypothetical protein